MAHESQPKNEPRVLYRRALPGGGFVNVEEEALESTVHRGHIAVERRADPDRREGHEPPIIATAEGTTAQSVLRQLFAIASDNVAIARALLRWRSDGRAKF